MPDVFSFDGEGQTPLSPDDRAGLRPTWIADRGDLNTAEFNNIVKARATWVGRRLDQLLDDAAVRRLHADMFGDVWTWAGTYRSVDTNTGIDWAKISVAVNNLCEDARLWLADDGDLRRELARLHHRLVLIHPFPNGNGRHARLLVDALAVAAGEPVPSWNATKKDYLTALRAADSDHDDLDALIAVAWAESAPEAMSHRGRLGAARTWSPQ